VTSIKVPGHGLPPLPESGLDRAQAPRGASGAGAATTATSVDAVPVARGVEGSDAIGQIAQSLRSGSIGVEEAKERLLDHAVAGVQGRLTEMERADLLALLRDALAQDPALGALRETLRS
jgi:hypothetical protein